MIDEKFARCGIRDQRITGQKPEDNDYLLHRCGNCTFVYLKLNMFITTFCHPPFPPQNSNISNKIKVTMVSLHIPSLPVQFTQNATAPTNAPSEQ